MNYSKTSQTAKKQVFSKVCSKCLKKRKIAEFTSTKGRVCGVCRRKSKRIKKQSSKGYTNKVKDDEMKEIIRKRDKMICQRCGKKVEGSNAHTSHVYTKKAHPELRHDPMNLKLLCYYCHRQFWHKEPMLAKDWFEEKFPERAAYLRGKIRGDK